MRKIIIALAIISMLLHAFVPEVKAHGGEDHNDKQMTHTASKYFSSENSSEKYEVLVKYGTLKEGSEAHLKLFLSHVLTNEPISGAAIKVSNPDKAGQDFKVSELEAGIYEIHTVFAEKKTYKLNVFINASAGADLIQLGGIETGKELPHTDISEKEPSASAMNIVFIIAALLGGVMIGLFIKRKTVAGRTGISILLLGVMLFSPLNQTALLAHGDDDHGAKKNSNAGASMHIEIAKETQFLFAVKTARTEMNNFSPSVNLFGTVMPTSYGRAVLQSPQTGVIRSLKVTVGQNVKKGELLASLEQSIDAGTRIDWLTRQGELNAELKAAKKEYDRLKGVEDIAAKKEIDEAERRLTTARENLNEFQKLGSTGSGNSKITLLYAPISGKVDNFNLSIGSTVNAGQEILTITDINTVYVEAQVFDKDAERVKSGKEYLVECSDDHSTRKVKPITITPSINVSNQSQRVLFEMENTDGDFKIGEFVNIRVFNEQASRSLVLPNSAITEINGKPAVFIKDAAEQYRLVYVSTGENNGMFTTVLKGLEENETVVVSATYQLKMMYLNQ